RADAGRLFLLGIVRGPRQRRPPLARALRGGSRPDRARDRLCRHPSAAGRETGFRVESAHHAQPDADLASPGRKAQGRPPGRQGHARTRTFPMKPFLNGKKSLSVTPLRTVQSTSPLPAPAIVRPAPTGPTVETVKQGDKVMRLIVT